MEEKQKVIRNQKDTVFRMLYRDKRELLELYNALNGTSYQNTEELEIHTLENAIYIAVKNDVSFLLGAELNLYEHQASFNPNMPLRDLIYIARQLEKFLRKRSLYSGSLVKIPVPRFVVFYNANAAQPERRVLRLSDAFEKPTADPELELKVLMLNINSGNNGELMAKCRTLKEYSEYWIFLCDEIALPEIWKSDDRKAEIILCEFTRAVFYLTHRPLSWICHVQGQCL